MPNADIVNGWYRERLCSGPLARDTEAYNQVVAALPDLIARLDAAEAPLVAPEPPSVAPAPPKAAAAAAPATPPTDDAGDKPGA
jgi:hypothetical protein